MFGPSMPPLSIRKAIGSLVLGLASTAAVSGRVLPPSSCYCSQVRTLWVLPMGGSGSWWQNQARCSRQSQYDLDVQRPHRGDLSTNSHRGGRGPPRSNDRGGRSPFQDDDDQERRRAPAEPPKVPAGQGEGEGEAAGLRVNKIFARFASRREADRMVVAGRVKINGKLAEPGSRVVSGDVVTLDGKAVEWEGPATVRQSGSGPQPAGSFVYIKYWKPRGIITTTDESVPYNMISAINHPKRIFPVGRLDKDSSGLILLTNDGRVPNAVLRTERGHGKEYVVGVHTPISDDCLERLAKGVVISTPVQRDRTSKLITARTLPCDVTRVDPRSFRIVLREGRNRQIRRMCQALGYDVTRLHRRRVMDIDLKDLDGPGEWVELDRLERMSVQRAIDKAEQQAKEKREQGQGEEEEGEEDEEE